MTNGKKILGMVAIAMVAAILVTASTFGTDDVFAKKKYGQSNAQSAAVNNECSPVTDAGNDDTPTDVFANTLANCIGSNLQNQDSDGAALIANPSITTSQALQPETPSPSPSSPFTITGTGEANNASFVCDPPVDPSLTFSIDFSAQRDGTVSGTYTISASNGNSQQGGLTDGSTDGNTFTLSGVNPAACEDNQGNVPVDTITISGDCGDGVTITYRDPNTEATFTGNVECTLT